MLYLGIDHPDFDSFRNCCGADRQAEQGRWEVARTEPVGSHLRRAALKHLEPDFPGLLLFLASSCHLLRQPMAF